MQITHEEARTFIQFDADMALTSEKKATLSAHLIDCLECSNYAQEIREVEHMLLPIMKRQWNLQPVPLSLSVLRMKRKANSQVSLLLATRIALTGFVFVAFVFAAWQFLGSGSRSSSPMPVGVAPVPTPSIQTTNTRLSWDDCGVILYTVQGDDTLASIAHRFSVTKEHIVALNHLKVETVSTATELMIPVCNFTPTGTAESPTLQTITFTPLANPAVSTPGG